MKVFVIKHYFPKTYTAVEITYVHDLKKPFKRLDFNDTY